jgi:hypothetical protein
MVMEDCNDGLPSVDVAMVEIRRDEPDLLEDTEINTIRYHVPRSFPPQNDFLVAGINHVHSLETKLSNHQKKRRL